MKDYLANTTRKFIPVALVFAVIFLLLRIYEAILLANRPVGTSGIMQLELGALGYDLVFTCQLISIVYVFHILLSSILPRTTFVVTHLIFGFLLVLTFGVIHYFESTLIPLRADIFGYSALDIFQTVHSSGSLQWTSVISLMAMLTLVIVFFWKVNNQRVFKKASSATVRVCLGVFFVGWFLPHSPSPESFKRDLDYSLAVNKTQFFLASTVGYLKERTSSETTRISEFPLFHRINSNDVLGKYFRESKSKPNIVFLIVEGLGRDFMGPDASYGGFTPFLDSLSAQSLFWENFLSNAGRTFGALPSILGSLPYGQAGFMSYATNMPNHTSLINLLKPYGYTSSFFYGGNPNFDNQDLFLEYQGFNRLIDHSKFPPSFSLKNQKVQQSLWGYSDHEVFSFASEVLQSTTSPHVDVYLTLSTHEPFTVPETEFEKKFDERLLLLDLEESKRKAIKADSSIFTCLLYTDNAIRDLFKYYTSREDFNNTIFIITGDHRLIPFPMENKIRRFHVPLIIYSPLLKQPETFSSIAIHSDITPSILNFLGNRCGMKFPQEMPFVSGPLSTDKSFSSVLDIALIRNKNGTNDYVDGEYLLSDDRLYTILPNLGLKPITNEQIKKRLSKKLREFKSNSIYACENDRLDKNVYAAGNQMLTLSETEDAFLKSIEVDTVSPDQQLKKAQQLSYKGNFFESRAILKHLLNRSPNYHDARVLLGRTFGWDQKYDSAVIYLKQTIDRTPLYTDAFCAWADVEYWRGDLRESLSIIEKGLLVSEHDSELLARKARTFMKLGKTEEATRIVNDILTVTPSAETAIEVRRQLNNK